MTRAHELGYSHADAASIAGKTVMGAIAKSASVLAFQDAFIAAGMITLVTLFLVFLLPSKPVAHNKAEPIHLE
jgi:hypothetical protein